MAGGFCPHCGAPRSEGALFCEQCGARLAAAQQQYQQPNNQYEYDPYGQGGRYQEPAKGGKKWLLPVILIIALLAAGIGIFAYTQMNKETEIDITKDFDDRVLDLSGQDGEGFITGIDYDKIRENLDYNDQSSEVKSFIDQISYTTDKDGVTGLVNGDKVTVTAEYPVGMADDLHLKVKNGSGGEVTTTIKIERLEAKDVNIQESVNDLNVNYNNASGLQVESDESIRYILSNIYLTESDIADLNYEATQRMINYIYANNGYEFQTASAKAYFETFDWYWNVPNKTEDQDVAKSRFNAVEKANEKLLVKRRDQLK